MENLQLDTKYKARLPEETIKIIEDFFASKNCYPDLIELKQSEVGTYFCYYELKFHGKTILSSSGKGTSELFCKASGLAELYERYCATPTILHNAINYHNLLKANYDKTKQYHISPDEKILSYEDLKKIPLAMRAITPSVPDLREDLIKKFLGTLCGDTIYASRYINIDKNNSDKEFYFNGVLSTSAMGSTGLAAGNIIEEALIQGISEIYEREAHVKFMIEGQKKYYYLDNDNLPEYLKSIIKKLENLGYEIYIYDLSYNFKLPVCMALVINKEKHCFFTHFGAFPVIEIAIERCITELYQGNASLINDKKRKVLIPITHTKGTDILDTMTSGAYKRELIIDNIFFESQKIPSYNDLIFKSGKDCTAEELLQHIYKINALNGYNFFYKEISMCDEIKAIHILSKEGIGCCNILIEEELKDIVRNDTNGYYDNSIYLAYSIIEGMIKCATRENEITLEELNNYLIDLHNHLPKDSLDSIYSVLDNMVEIISQEYTNPFKCQDKGSNHNGLYAQLLLEDFEELNIDTNSDFGEYVILWNFYYLYCIKDGASLKNYNKIIEKLGYEPVNINQENFTPVHFINEIFVKNIRRLYNSDEYHEFINMFVK